MAGIQRSIRMEVMINRSLFALIFAGIGALAYGWYYNNQRIVAQQQSQIEKFIKAGPRFTASDGMVLCLRIQKLEKLSYGYRDAGYVPLDCDYLTREIDK